MGAALEQQDAKSVRYAPGVVEALPGFVLQWAPGRAGLFEDRQEGYDQSKDKKQDASQGEQVRHRN